MSEVVYEVLTEFVFDVRGAITNSNMLKNAVDNISSAADGAFLSLHKLGDFASHGLGLNLSVMGVLTGAFASFDHFRKTQISFANIIASNMAHLTGNIETFNDKLDVSRSIMKDVAKIAREYSLDESAMMATTKTLAAFLTPAGLSGKNMGNAVDMARMFEKSAPMLGIDTNQAQGELIRAISGQASMQDTLFRRLATEAPEVMGKYVRMNMGGMMPGGFGTQAGGTVGLGMGHGQLNAIGASGVSYGGMGHHAGASMFNMLPMAQRFDLLNRAMAKFSNNAEVNAANAELLSNKLRVLKNIFVGYDGVLLPLGEVLSNHVRPILIKLIDFIQAYARPALERFSEALEKAFQNPERIYATIRQLQQARSDLQQAIHLTHVFGEVLFGLWIIKLPMVRALLATVGSSLLSILGLGARFAGFSAGLAGLGFNLGTLRLGFKVFGFIAEGLLFVFQRFVAPLAIIFGFLQLLSRAEGYAQAADAKVLVDNSKKLGGTAIAVSQNIYKMIAPIDELWDAAARAIAPLFQYSTYLKFIAAHMEQLVTVTDMVAKYVLYACGVIAGFAAVFKKSWSDVWNFLAVGVDNFIIIIIDGMKKLGLAATGFSKLLTGNVAGGKQDFMSMYDKPKLLDTPSDMFTSNAQLTKLYTDTALGFVDGFQKKLKDPNNKEKNVSNNVTNIGAVNVHQDFKENMEPDRIARSLVDVLKSIATNPTQSAGRSFPAGVVTR